MKATQILQNGLIRLGRDVYLRKPPGKPVPIKAVNGSVASSLKTAPSIILLFGWMGAQLPHLLKYSNAYSEMYPESTQIIVRSEPSYFWTSKKPKKASIQPVVETLEAIGCLPPSTSSPTSKLLRKADVQPLYSYPTPSILVHAFSNGGAWQLTTLSEILSSQTYPPSTTLSPTALVLDSCPGNGGVDGTIKAFSGVVRNPILRNIIAFIIRLIYFYTSLRRRFSLSVSASVLDRMKARLNTAQLLPWFTKDTPRLYIYSAKDDVIPYHEVEKHAAKAREVGLNVRMEMFEDSKHVAHARADPERYWGAVNRLWEDAVRAGGGEDSSSKSEVE